MPRRRARSQDDSTAVSTKRPRLEERSSLGSQLIDAAKQADLELVNSLVKRGASLRSTQNGKSALDHAIQSNDLVMVEYLLSHGADPNFDGRRNSGATKGAPPVVSAARRGNSAILSAVLAASADVNQPGGIGQTALHVAAYHGHRSAVIALLAAGAIVDAKTIISAKRNTWFWKGSTPLHLAASAGHADVIRTLLRAGSQSLNALTIGGHPAKLEQDGVFTPLHFAVKSCNRAAVRMLLRAGACLRTPGSFGGTAFDFAVYARNTDVMAMLASHSVLQQAEHLSLRSCQPFGRARFAKRFFDRVRLDPRHHFDDKDISPDDVMDHHTATLLAGLLANATYPGPLALQAAELRLVVASAMHTRLGGSTVCGRTLGVLSPDLQETLFARITTELLQLVSQYATNNVACHSHQRKSHSNAIPTACSFTEDLCASMWAGGRWSKDGVQSLYA